MPRTLLRLPSAITIVICLLLFVHANTAMVGPPRIHCPNTVTAGEVLTGDVVDPARQLVEIEFIVDGVVVLLVDDDHTGAHVFALEVLPEWAGKTIEISVTTEDGRTASRSVTVQ